MTIVNGRQRVLDRIQGRPVDSLPLMPITMMFAADRIGRKYRDYVTDYRVLVEGQLRVAEEFDFDYVSCISDPAREAADCGAPVVMPEDQPPAFDEANALLADKTRLAHLKAPDPHGGGRMTDRIRAVELFKKRAGDAKLIEGWIEGPCAEGADLRGLNNLMMDFFEDPVFVKDLFEFVAQMELQFARAQLEAGAELIGLGDAAASLVGPDIYNEFVFPYEKRLIDGIHAMGGLARLHICGNTRPLLESIGKLHADIVDLDYPSPLSEARAKMGDQQVLLGNLHPVTALRNSTPPAISQAIAECHRQAGQRYIVGVGCEIPRDTPVENVHALRMYARSQRG